MKKILATTLVGLLSLFFQTNILAEDVAVADPSQAQAARMKETASGSYCLSCHEMQGNSFDDLQETVHYSNRTGVRATCPDCHVPKEWTHKVVQKITATMRELPAHWSGKLDTPEKFEEHRLDMAKLEWKRMTANGSRECKNCHDAKSMDYTKQEPRSSVRHEEAAKAGMTCIECHKGIAHHLPAGWENAAKEIEPSEKE